MEGGEGEGAGLPFGPFRSLIHEQAKSIVAIQELKRDVELLLEFREQVLSSFPHLMHSVPLMTPSASSATKFTGVTHDVSHHHPGAHSAQHLRPPGSGRKLPQPHGASSDPLLFAQPESDTSDEMESQGPGGRGTWKRPSSTRYLPRTRRKKQSVDVTSTTSRTALLAPMAHVVDSGFSTETKDVGSGSERNHVYSDRTSSSSAYNYSDRSSERNLVYSDMVPDIRWPGRMVGPMSFCDDELWNLLDVIHRKGVRLREEIRAEDVRVPIPAPESALSDTVQSNVRRLSTIAETVRSSQSLGDTRSKGLGERDSISLSRVFQTQVRVKDPEESRIQELEALVQTLNEKNKHLEEELYAATAWKTEVDSRIHNLHAQFARGKREPYQDHDSNLENQKRHDISPFTPEQAESRERGWINIRSKSEVNIRQRRSQTSNVFATSLPTGSKTERKIVAIPNKKISSVLWESDILTLRKQLLHYIHAYEMTKAKLDEKAEEWSLRARDWDRLSKEWREEVRSLRDENQEFRFQLEEKVIELEGTKARLRMMERALGRGLKPTTSIPGDVTLPRPLRRIDHLSYLRSDLDQGRKDDEGPQEEGSPAKITFRVGGEDEEDVRTQENSLPVKLVRIVPEAEEGREKESSSTESSGVPHKNVFLLARNNMNSGDEEEDQVPSVPPPFPLDFLPVIPPIKPDLVQSQTENFYFAKESPLLNGSALKMVCPPYPPAFDDDDDDDDDSEFMLPLDMVQ
ncbi:unnamed protein product [Darwinula stevensoni]|uniref:Uncharacterized protein n=1 Tax=Darwinula stevensoni TaxID=69355 RepID=A0A7R8X3Q5_9CRUS|nr:unnamed protein product [Darwinula stevensoni]CAG0885258.1 unnamed protein product [Darwinula stevensoni]